MSLLRSANLVCDLMGDQLRGSEARPIVRTLAGQPHLFRTRNELIKAQRTRSNEDEIAAKSTKLIDILLPLRTVWSQVGSWQTTDEFNSLQISNCLRS
jgi:hypothetical protein